MLTRINNNIGALNASRNLNTTSIALGRSLERLSSGLRINRAADDAAGLTISENLRSQINGLNQAIDNASSALNLVNTAEGALAETTNRLQRIRTLAVQAANTGTNDSVALRAIQDEIQTSIAEITRIGNDTQFATRRLINGDNANSASMQTTGTGISLSRTPTASTLSTGTRYLTVTQTAAGSEIRANGVDGVDNTGATNFTGSTFDSGSYDMVLSNVVAAQARVVSTSDSITTDGTTLAVGTDLLDGLVIDGYTVAQTDELEFTVVESDGTSTAVTVTVGAANDIDSVVTAINAAIGTDTASYDAATGQFVVTAAATGTNTNLSISLSIDDSGNGGAAVGSLSNTVRVAGNENTATMTVGGGPSQAVTAGDTITAYGPTPSDPSESAAQITFTLGATLTAGTDTLTIVAQAYEGSLEGGTTVNFQNGASKVQFQSGTAAGFAAGETVTLDFDAVIDLDGGSSRTFLIEATNNSLAFQVGANQNQRVSVQFGDLRATNLGFVGDTQPSGAARTVAGIDVTTLTGANEAIAIIDEAINQVDSQRSALGAFTNRLEATMANLGVAAENLTASESRIRDADIAFETTRFTRNQILLQAGTAILAQANSAPQGVLALLR